MATAKATTDHDAIRKWVEARGGHPAHVKATGKKNDPGVLRIDYPGYSGGDTLEEMEWDEFFEWFDRDGLAMLLSPGKSRFSKFVKRTGGGSSRKAATKKASAKKASAKKSMSTKKASASSKKSAATKKATATKKAAGTSKKASSTKKASSAKKTTSAKKASSSTKKATSAKKSSSTKKATSSKKATTRKATSSKKPATSNTTTDHDEIRQWVESRGGVPAQVRKTGRKSGDLGVLRIDYPGYSGRDTLERVEWDPWFDAFDRNGLAFLYQKKRDSRFSKLVNR